jgi:hypothetical protein
MLIVDLTEAIQAKWPQAIVSVFGSYIGGLSTFLSDIDISILGMGVEGGQLESMMESTGPADTENLVRIKDIALQDSDCKHEGSSEDEEANGLKQITWTITNVPSAATSLSVGETGEEVVSWQIDSNSNSEVIIISDSEDERDEDLNDVICLVDDDDDSEDESEPFYPDDSDSDISHDRSKKRRKSAVQLEADDFVFNTTTNIMDGSFSSTKPETSGRSAGLREVQSKSRQLEKRKRHSALLKVLFSHLRVMDWMTEVEFRSKAKVPIIYITHRSGIGCDVSMGVTAEDTTQLVLALKDIDADAFLILSTFLKVFLNLLALDKPYNGGIHPDYITPYFPHKTCVLYE